MTILQDYETRVDCDDSHCSLRYYTKGEPLCIGLLRSHYYDAGGLNGLIVTVSEWNVGELLEDISEKYGIGPNEMLNVVGDIKADAVRRIKEHLTKGIV
jgi:hypothetical protein